MTSRRPDTLLIVAIVGPILFFLFGLLMYYQDHKNTQQLRRLSDRSYAKWAIQARENGDREKAAHYQRLSELWEEAARNPWQDAPEVGFGDFAPPKLQHPQNKFWRTPAPAGELPDGMWAQPEKLSVP